MWRVQTKANQSGQAMVLSLILMSMAVMVLLVSYNASQLNLNASRLQNTADNTAYTVAAIAARDMNFKAYTNRASVSNHLAIAQMVGLSSWFNMADKFAENACRYFCWVPYLGQVLKGVEQAVGAINSAAQPTFAALIYAENVILKALNVAQAIMHYATFASAIDTAKEVVRANDPKAELSLMQNILLAKDISDVWLKFQKRHSRDDKRFSLGRRNRGNSQFQEHIGLIHDSRDPFSEKRTYKLGFPFSGKIPFSIKWRTQKTGGSQLISNRGKAETWTSMDTLSFYLYRFKCSWRGCRWRGGETPVGWGGTRTDKRASIATQHSRSYWGDSRRVNSLSANLAGDQQIKKGRYSGVQPYYGLSNRNYKANRTRNIAIVVSKSQSNMRTTSTVKSGSKVTNPALKEKMLGERSTALASSQVFYSRPVDLRGTSAWSRDDGKYEYGNLYNPFWQPRLSQSTSRDRSFVLALTRLI